MQSLSLVQNRPVQQIQGLGQTTSTAQALRHMLKALVIFAFNELLPTALGALFYHLHPDKNSTALVPQHQAQDIFEKNSSVTEQATQFEQTIRGVFAIIQMLRLAFILIEVANSTFEDKSIKKVSELATQTAVAYGLGVLSDQVGFRGYLRELLYSHRSLPPVSIPELGGLISTEKLKFSLNTLYSIFEKIDQSLTFPGTKAQMVGSIAIFAEEYYPVHYIECDGRSLDKTQYPELFTALGYKYGGSGDNFKIPDSRGLFLRGWDHGSGIDPDANSRIDRGDGTAGDRAGTRQAHQIFNHIHNTTWGTHGFGTGSRGSFARGQDLGPLDNQQTDSYGGSETRPKNMAVVYAICTKDVLGQYETAIHQLQQQLANLNLKNESDFGEVGQVATFSTENIPKEFLRCEGTLLRISDYSDLYSRIGNRFGGDKTQGTFKLPDYRGFFLRMEDLGSGNDPDAPFRVMPNGTKNSGSGSIQMDASQEIYGTVAIEAGIHGNGLFTPIPGGDGGYYGAGSGSTTMSFNSSKVTRSSTETRPKNVAVTFAIRVVSSATVSDQSPTVVSVQKLLDRVTQLESMQKNITTTATTSDNGTSTWSIVGGVTGLLALLIELVRVGRDCVRRNPERYQDTQVRNNQE